MSKFQNKASNVLIIDGARLSEIRIKAQISLEQVATNLGCNKSQVSRWEQSKLTPSEERILKMVEMFKTDEFVILKPARLVERLLKLEAGGEAK